MFNKLSRLRSRSNNTSGSSQAPKGYGRLEPSLNASRSFSISSGTSPPFVKGSKSPSSRWTSLKHETDFPASEAETHIGETDSIDEQAAAKPFPENKSATLSRRESFRPEEESKQSLGPLPSLLPGHLASKKTWVSSSVPQAGFDPGADVLPPFEAAEEAFLEEFEDYFANLSVDNVRKDQYPKLDLHRFVYLDYANFALFSRFQVEEHAKVIQQEAPSLRAASLENGSASHLVAHVTETHERLLELFNTNKDEYSVIFTTGVTAAFRLLAEAYSFPKGSSLLVCQDNHEAVKMITIAAGQQGVKPMLAAVGEVNLSMHSTMLRRTLRSQGQRNGLFVYPAQSCMSGVKHSLNWILEAQQSGWNVLVDISTYIPSGHMDLSVVQPEFAIGSFRHLLGYPAGMGFLLVKKSAFTVRRGLGLYSLKFTPTSSVGQEEPAKDYHIVAEDENINLLSFAALNFGLQHLEAIGLDSIRKRVQCLTAWLVTALKALQHKGEEGRSLVHLYGPQTTHDRGSIVAFNLVDSTGTVVSTNLVKQLAEKNNIFIGSGTFCNPGLANALSRPSERVKDVSYFDKVSTFSSIRVSFGPVSAFPDVYRLVYFLSRFRDEDYVASEAIAFTSSNEL